MPAITVSLSKEEKLLVKRIQDGHEDPSSDRSHILKPTLFAILSRVNPPVAALNKLANSPKLHKLITAEATKTYIVAPVAVIRKKGRRVVTVAAAPATVTGHKRKSRTGAIPADSESDKDDASDDDSDGPSPRKTPHSHTTTTGSMFDGEFDSTSLIPLENTIWHKSSDMVQDNLRTRQPDPSLRDLKGSKAKFLLENQVILLITGKAFTLYMVSSTGNSGVRVNRVTSAVATPSTALASYKLDGDTYVFALTERSITHFDTKLTRLGFRLDNARPASWTPTPAAAVHSHTTRRRSYESDDEDTSDVPVRKGKDTPAAYSLTSKAASVLSNDIRARESGILQLYQNIFLTTNLHRFGLYENWIQIQPCEMLNCTKTLSAVDLRQFAQLTDKYGPKRAEELSRTFYNVKTEVDKEKLASVDLHIIGNSIDKLDRCMRSFLLVISSLFLLADEITDALISAEMRYVSYLRPRLTAGPESPITGQMILITGMSFQRDIDKLYMRVFVENSTRAELIRGIQSLPDVSPDSFLLLELIHLQHQAQMLAHPWGSEMLSPSTLDPNSVESRAQKRKADKAAKKKASKAKALTSVDTVSSPTTQPKRVVSADLCGYFHSRHGCTPKKGTCTLLHRAPSSAIEHEQLQVFFLKRPRLERKT